jgi:uncharacterized protein
MASRPLLAYFSIACAISWLAWLPRIATQQGWWGWFVPEWWHYAGAAGPIAAALLVVFRTEGRAGAVELLSQYRVRPPDGWLLFALGSPLVLFAIGALVARGVTGAWPAFAEVAKTQNLPALGLPLTLLVHVITFGIGEETGWRGFALPRLQARHDALRATLLLSVGWALWHVPSFFGNVGFANFGPVDIVGWFIGLVLGAIFLTWLYNSTRGSLMAIVLWHGVFNALVASEAAAGLIAAVMTTGIMVLAIVALIRSGRQHLAGLAPGAGTRQIAPAARPPVATTAT